MLRNTFCHIPGIGVRKEQNLWASGVLAWDDFPAKISSRGSFSNNTVRLLESHIEQSFLHLEEEKPDYFAERLPSAQHWRLFPDFRRTTAYLDIETTGMGGPDDAITTIALYDGESVFTYIQGDNLERFGEEIERYKVLVTYNGKCFDIPFIRNTLHLPMRQAHIDLRYVLRSLGYGGGLKGCERQLGLDREELSGVDGFFAVLLWNDYQHSGKQESLETLLAYNIQDAVNLETLMVMAYNLKLKETPFDSSHVLPLPTPPQVPFKADRNTIERIQRECMWNVWE